MPGGEHFAVTDDNKLQYIQLVAAHKMTAAIQVTLNGLSVRVFVVVDDRSLTFSFLFRFPFLLLLCVQAQLKAFLGGFHEMVPAHLLKVFNEHELELLISGLPTIDGKCFSVMTT